MNIAFILFVLLSFLQQPVSLKVALEAGPAAQRSERALSWLLERVVDQPNQAIAEETNILILLKHDQGATIKALFALLDAYQKREDQHGAKRIAKRLVKLTANSRDRKQIFRAHLALGTVSLNLSEYDEAERHYLISKDLAKTLGQPGHLASTINNLGNVAYFRGEYQQSVSYYLDALAIREDTNDQPRIASTLNNIGLVYLDLKQSDLALEYFNRTLILELEQNQPARISEVLNNIGAVYYEEKDYPHALDYFNQSLAIEEELGSQSGVAYLLNDIGLIHLQLGNHARAEQKLKQALGIRKELEDQSLVCNTQLSLGQVYMTTKKYDRAEKHLESALEIAKEIGVKKLQMDSYKSLAKMHETRGNYQQALDFFQRYKRTNDALFNEQEINQINALSARYEADQREKEIDLLKKDAQFKEQARLEEQARQALVRNALLVIVVLIAVTLALIYKHREQKNKLSNERRLNRLKDDFLANTSHELRTPLNGIIGLAESLTDGATGKLPQETMANLRMIAASGKRLATLVDDILDFSKLRHNTIVLIRNPVDLRSLLDVVLALCQPLAASKGLELKNDLDPNLPLVLGDENRLQQMFFNLVGNGIKFTEKGHVRVFAEHAGEMLMVHIQDTGIGIEQAYFESIFHSFEQGDAHIEREFSGTGLGLSVTKHLVELHEGDIWVESGVGKGATFILTLPVAKNDRRFRQRDLPLKHAFGKRDLGTILLPQETIRLPTRASTDTFKILVVDDEPINRQVLINHLTMENYYVVEAADGDEALTLLEREPDFNLVLLDIMMPQMSGFEVCKKLRERLPLGELPLIFLSAKNQTKDMVAGFNMGANDYLNKPISKVELLARVKTHLALFDINRNLDRKVAERTAQLAERNAELQEKQREILNTQQQLILQEKMASLGTMTAGIAHEIRNPLNFVNNFSEIIAELAQDLDTHFCNRQQIPNANEWANLKADLHEIKENALLVVQNGKRTELIVRNMMSLVPTGNSRPREDDLSNLVSRTSQLAFQARKSKLEHLDIQLEIVPAGKSAPCRVLVQEISRLMINLLNNAIEAVEMRQMAAPYLGKICININALIEGYEIRVRDNGVGISQEHLSRIFDPFYTTKPPLNGHIGLGLAICFDICVQHRGTLRLESELGQYTEVIATIVGIAQVS